MGGFPGAGVVELDGKLLACPVEGAVADGDVDHPGLAFDLAAKQAAVEVMAPGDSVNGNVVIKLFDWNLRRGAWLPLRGVFGRLRHFDGKTLCGRGTSQAQGLSHFADALRAQHAEPPFFFLEIGAFFKVGFRGDEAGVGPPLLFGAFA